MDITFQCPHCNQQLVIDASGAGLQVPCPHCQQPVTVPETDKPEGEPVRHTGIRLRQPLPSPSTEPATPYPLPALSHPHAPPHMGGEPTADEEVFECLNPECGATWFRSHLSEREYRGTLVYLCPRCHLALKPVGDAATFNFWGAVPGAFVFPFRGRGGYVLVMGTLFFAALDLGRWLVCLLWPLVTLMFYGMLGMLLVDVIRTAAQERDPELDWPDFGDMGSVVVEGLRFIATFVVVIGPAVLSFIMAGVNLLGPPTTVANISIATGVWAVAGVVFLAGAFLYYPMAVLSVSMLDTIMGVNPVLVLRGIFKAPLEYGCVIALLAILLACRVTIGVGIDYLPSQGLQWAALLPARCIGFYGLIVSAHLLGLLFRARGDKFGWF
jgi:phage FluMu protein Com